ncbi:tetratricopeptide repeat protein 31 isoform X3 [Dama dama]|uniref:tetratricopeptide repeat protein 31 isoform X3 n=1 Tax=Dama dama TaxID=30532 RepID=UPI002A3720D7|nr:tetratricopeptide repeat protein 31 isoform X3 [Dama dama]
MDSLALRKRMLPPSTKMAAYAVSLRPWPLSNTLLSFILASLLTGMAPIPKTAGLIKLGKQAFLCGLAARWGSLLSPNTAGYSVLRAEAPPRLSPGLLAAALQQSQELASLLNPVWQNAVCHYKLCHLGQIS